MQHGLVLDFDSGRVGKDQNLGDKLAVDFWHRNDTSLRVRLVGFVQHDHAFSDVLPLDVTQG